jgi:hypothetical protein
MRERDDERHSEEERRTAAILRQRLAPEDATGICSAWVQVGCARRSVQLRFRLGVLGAAFSVR